MSSYQITTKGQITIPVGIRRLLRLTTKDNLIFETEGDKVIIRKSPTFKSIAGSLKKDIKKNNKLTPKEAINLAWEIRAKEYAKRK